MVFGKCIHVRGKLKGWVHIMPALYAMFFVGLRMAMGSLQLLNE